MRNSACVLAATCIASTLAVPAFAETVNCTSITTLPYTISVQGVYCLTGDLVTGITSGAAITVATNNVTIDLNGYKVGGQAAGAGTDARGIVASNRSNVRIHNGVVRGFRYGVSLFLGSGHVIENMLLDFNTEKGIDVSSANGVIVRGNRVNNTGGTTFGVRGLRHLRSIGFRRPRARQRRRDHGPKQREYRKCLWHSGDGESGVHRQQSRERLDGLWHFQFEQPPT